MSPSDHEVNVDWKLDDSTIYWNELCADIMEVFGLPGGRYITNTSVDFMTFTFKNKKDAELCKILISQHL